MLLPAVDPFTETDDVFWGNVEQQRVQRMKRNAILLNVGIMPPMNFIKGF